MCVCDNGVPRGGWLHEQAGRFALSAGKKPEDGRVAITVSLAGVWATRALEAPPLLLEGCATGMCALPESCICMRCECGHMPAASR